jgi:hypothetical protein
MLTDSIVLDFVKSELGYPFTEIELCDKDILHRLKTFMLRYFSRGVPLYKYVVINTADPKTKVDERNTYEILDKDNAGIIDVFDVISDNEVVMSLNILGSQGLQYSDLPNWYSAYQARATGFLTTNWYQIFEFTPPNFIAIRPGNTIPSNFAVCYEAQHVCFETIPPIEEPLIFDMSIAYIKRNIGTIRSKYATVETQFGAINLNWEQWKTEGNELWDRCMEKLDKKPPRVILDIG